MSLEIWPFDFGEVKRTGFTDSQLLKAVDPSTVEGFDRRIGERRLPYLYWVSELYSFGRCYRKVFGLPWFCPIPIYGDHGVCFLSYFEPHEASNPSEYHMTWYRSRAEALRSGGNNKNILHIPHPWILYRRKFGLAKSKKVSGTLVFYSHSNDGIEVQGIDKEYFDSLRGLTEEFHPIVICLHQHDVNKKLHEKLRMHSFPIITMGYTNSMLFIDRFYDLVGRFKYATSPSGGSELFYCHELGVKYFIHGREPKFVNVRHKAKPIGDLSKFECSLTKSSNEKKRRLFTKAAWEDPRMETERDAFVSEVLGLDQIKDLDVVWVRNLLILKSIKAIPRYIVVLMQRAASKIVKRLG